MSIVWDDDVTQLDAAHMNQLEQITRKAQPNGYASLGADGLVPPAQLPAIPPLVITDADIPASITRDTELAAGLATKADSAAVAAADVLKVDKDSVVVAATRLVASKLLAGDAQPAFSVLGDGRHQWGAGGAAASDVLLYRESAGRLRTNGFFRAWDTIIGAIGPSSATGIRFLDTDIYRGGPQLLQTDTAFVVGGDMVVNNQGGSKLYFGSSLALDTTLFREAAGVLTSDGEIRGNPLNVKTDGQKIYFGPSYDTSLYRAGATVLKTDGVLYVGSNVIAKQGLAQQVFIGDLGDTVPSLAFGSDAAVSFRRYGNDLSFFGSKFQFGSAFDANLYRAAAASLKTDTSFTAGASLVVGTNDPNGAIYFGSALDTKLYRWGANQLQTDGYLFSGLAIYAQRGAATEVGLVAYQGAYPAVSFGNTGDTNLYRSGVNALTTGGSFQAAGNLGTNGNLYVLGGYSYWGSASDVNLYRVSAGNLKTDNDFTAKTLSPSPPGHAVTITGVLSGAVGGGIDSIQVYIDGVPRRIPVFA